MNSNCFSHNLLEYGPFFTASLCPSSSVRFPTPPPTHLQTKPMTFSEPPVAQKTLVWQPPHVTTIAASVYCSNWTMAFWEEEAGHSVSLQGIWPWWALRNESWMVIKSTGSCGQDHQLCTFLSTPKCSQGTAASSNDRQPSGG